MELDMRFLIIKLLDLCVYLCYIYFWCCLNFVLLVFQMKFFIFYFFAQILGSLPLFELHYFMSFFQVKK